MDQATGYDSISGWMEVVADGKVILPADLGDQILNKIR